MKYNIEYNSEKKYVKANIEDEIELKYLSQFVTDVNECLKTNNCHRVLNDLRTASVKMTIIEIDEVPKLFSQLEIDILTKRALIVSDDIKKYNFFESTSRSRRQDVRIFSSYSKAEEWLLSDEAFSSQAIPLSEIKEFK